MKTLGLDLQQEIGYMADNVGFVSWKYLQMGRRFVVTANLG